MRNLDVKTVEGFGQEWTSFDQSELSSDELSEIFQSYFEIFPWHALPDQAVGFDLGCGSGRWAKFVAPRVGKLMCIDASAAALQVAKMNLRDIRNCEFYLASVDEIPVEPGSMDFGYALGVVHHFPDPREGIRACVEKLKPNAPFLLYVYYALENRPFWFRALWRVSDLVRRMIAPLPYWAKYGCVSVIALAVYWPIARLARLLEVMGANVAQFPLSAYRTRSLYTMRTDAMDRFGTRVEHRFTSDQIREMMEHAGLQGITFSRSAFWCGVGYKKP